MRREAAGAAVRGGLALLGLALLPWVLGGDFYVNLASQVLIYALLALSLNLLIGAAGLTSLGHAAYLGIAAYAAAWLTGNAGFGALPAALAALAIGTASAAVFGVLALRASGLGFLMITLALGQIVWGVAYRWVSLTGGDNGIRLADRPAVLGFDLGTPVAFYYFAAAVFALAFLFLRRLALSPLGACLRGTKEQPRRMAMLGHHVWMLRWIAFVLAGFWGSVAGLLYLYYHKFVSPQALSLQQSAEALLMVLLGGSSTLAGPVVGAAVITLVKNLVSSYVDRWLTLLGVIFVAVVVFMPQGIVPGLAGLLRRLRALRPERAGAAPPRAAAGHEAAP
ncbi:branched-chain amino acid ABC transporter permease [Caldovatus aquaticus]|uniref:Branched-chain amino acid ABC transporter permease n=1 Tax=Caldovatus aquaticus TaxID=2865671 RepID=A0ABS7EX84_9PROT|nr:branched-chain amino acid ABC transporter permease [Caldovatus aquaticus]MBW8267961.1 branched-chain amino acid ABC transporter permease [Caldovatus aquaticus]